MEEVNPFGPLHAYVAPVTLVVIKFNVFPSQTGEFELAAGAAGVGFTVTAKVEFALVPQELDAFTEIFPDVFPNVTVTDEAPFPDMVAPEGAVQLYVVAVGTEEME